jgi:PKD repeat protein
MTMRRSPRSALVVGAALLAACGGETSGPFGDPGDPPSATQPGDALAARFAFSCAGLACAFVDQSVGGEGGGEIVSRAWDFGDGRISAERSPLHTYAAEGTYRVGLTVADSRGKTATTTTPVTVPAGALGAADFSVSCQSTLCFFANETPGISGDEFLLRWDFGDGTTGAERYHRYGATTPTAFTVTLAIWAWDANAGFVLIAVGSKQVTVTPVPSVVAFSVACSSLACTFTDQSSGIDADIASWHWDFGDGGTSEEWNPTHLYHVTEPTTFTVTLTVRDFEGFDSSASQALTVTPAPPVCGGPPDC